jgi:hypothetical protein
MSKPKNLFILSSNSVEDEYYLSLDELCEMNENLVYKTIYDSIRKKGYYKTRDNLLTITKKLFKSKKMTPAQTFHNLFSDFLLKVENWEFNFNSNQAKFDYKNVAYKVAIYESKTRLYANDEPVMTSDNQQDIIDFIFA